MKLVVLFVILALFSVSSHADVQLDPAGCTAYAIWTHDVLWARDLGADKAKVRGSLVDLQRETAHPLYELMLRDFDKLWLTTVPRIDLAEVVARDCVNRRGKYGPEV